MIGIEIAQNQKVFPPGATVQGRTGWRLNRIPGKARLRLYHHTEGKGNNDHEIVEEYTLPTYQAQQVLPFKFQLPMGPYSFQGKLITLKWALELKVDREIFNLDIALTPWRKPLLLKSVSTENVFKDYTVV